MKITEKIMKTKPTRIGQRKPISIKIDSDLSNWLTKENLSPTAIFKEACRELGFNKVETYVLPKEKVE